MPAIGVEVSSRGGDRLLAAGGRILPWMVKHLKYADECGRACNPMTYLERVNSLRPVRFLIGECDPLVNVAAAKACASQFPDGSCYVVPGMGHGTTRFGPSFCDHVRYFLATQLGDWRE
jgi:hypothetical protein